MRVTGKLQVTDLDGDGDSDIVYFTNHPYGHIRTIRNIDSQGTFSAPLTIANNVRYARSIYSADFTGNGNADVLSIDDNKVAWRPFGSSAYASPLIVNSESTSPRSVYSADLDGDGDQDALSASSGDGSISWYENVGDDNCPRMSNADQSNLDGDSLGDICDDDRDGDGAVNESDAFPDEASETTDTDGDGVGDNSDAFPFDGSETTDKDGDGIGDNSDPDDDNDGVADGSPCDASSITPGGPSVRISADGPPGTCYAGAIQDVSWFLYGGCGTYKDYPVTPDQPVLLNLSGDICIPNQSIGHNPQFCIQEDAGAGYTDQYCFTEGESCCNDCRVQPAPYTPVTDHIRVVVASDFYLNVWTCDTVPADNCPLDPNPGQEDLDGDLFGDACDDDDDGDGVADETDAFPLDPTEQVDSDSDGVGDNADDFPTDPGESADTDGDAVGDNADAFPLDPTETADSDSDGVGNNGDNCPSMLNSNQSDLDGDGIGDICDPTPLPGPRTMWLWFVPSLRRQQQVLSRQRSVGALRTHPSCSVQ